MSFSQKLLAWYQDHRRDLPWRGIDDPYKIWVSEIILQQTRVAQGWDYYLHFIDTFPTINELANSPIEKVLKVWQGLGYYSRARNMHYTAQIIKELHHGIFPEEYDQIRSLKGIGEYTAAAIASIAYNLPYPAVDGNVMRVISRIFGIYDDISTQKTKKTITERCKTLLGNSNPGEFNQAMMELGALQCVPKNPDCEICPFINECFAYNHNTIHLLPVKKSTISIRKRYFHYFAFTTGKETLLTQRKDNDIWKELFQFPMYESNTESDSTIEERLISFQHPVNPDFFIKHQLSHQLLHLSFYIIQTDKLPAIEGSIAVKTDRIHEFPFPIVIASFINDYFCNYSPPISEQQL